MNALISFFSHNDLATNGAYLMFDAITDYVLVDIYVAVFGFFCYYVAGQICLATYEHEEGLIESSEPEHCFEYRITHEVANTSDYLDGRSDVFVDEPHFAISDAEVQALIDSLDICIKPEMSEDLNCKTIRQLKSMASELGIKGYGNMVKSELIAAIK